MLSPVECLSFMVYHLAMCGISGPFWYHKGITNTAEITFLSSVPLSQGRPHNIVTMFFRTGVRI